MKKTLILCTLYALAAMSAASALADDFTVKQNGTSDYTTIQACADVAQQGDTCLVSAGTYNETVNLPRSGAEGAPITFQAASGPRPVVSGGFLLPSRNHITISGFELGGWVRCSPFSGTACNWIKVLDNAFEDMGIGIQLRAYDVLISGNTFNNMTGDMIRQHGDRWTIRNNTVIGEIDANDDHMDFWQSFCGGGVSASYTLIENNDFIDISGGNVHFSLVNGTDSCGDAVSNMIHRFNKVRNIGSLAIYIDNNQQTSGCMDNSIYNNTFIDLSGGTFSQSQDYCSNLSASASSSALNNILVNAMDSANAEGFLFAAQGFSDYNLYFTPGATMTFTAPAAGEAHAVKNQDPTLVNPGNNNFSLQLGSPAIDKGGPLTHVAGADTGAGTALIVDAAEFFQPGWGGAAPDTLAVGNVSNTAQIASIDYASNLITLATAITRSPGDPIYLYLDSDGTRVLHGAAPDIGAVEHPGGGGDTTPPTVTLTAPAEGAVLSGDTPLSADAADDVGVAGVQFKVDGVDVGAEDATVPYSITWDTTLIAEGAHSLTAVARDTSDNRTTSAPVSVIVDNVPDELPPGCFMSGPSWQSQAFALQTGAFTFEFDATPSGGDVDSVFGLSLAAAQGYDDLAVAARFNNSGAIDARNGADYAADLSLAYAAGTSYHFRIEVDVPGRTFSVHVTPEGGSEQTVAASYGFRDSQASASSLSYWNIIATSGDKTVCDLSHSGGSGGDGGVRSDGGAGADLGDPPDGGARADLAAQSDGGSNTVPGGSSDGCRCAVSSPGSSGGLLLICLICIGLVLVRRRP